MRRLCAGGLQGGQEPAADETEDGAGSQPGHSPQSGHGRSRPVGARRRCAEEDTAVAGAEAAAQPTPATAVVTSSHRRWCSLGSIRRSPAACSPPSATPSTIPPPTTSERAARRFAAVCRLADEGLRRLRRSRGRSHADRLRGRAARRPASQRKRPCAGTRPHRGNRHVRTPVSRRTYDHGNASRLDCFQPARERRPPAESKDPGGRLRVGPFRFSTCAPR